MITQRWPFPMEYDQGSGAKTLSFSFFLVMMVEIVLGFRYAIKALTAILSLNAQKVRYAGSVFRVRTYELGCYGSSVRGKSSI